MGDGLNMVLFDGFVRYCLCMLLQETYEVLDALFYDDGIVNPNPNWDCNYVTRSTVTEGVKFLVNTSNPSARASMNPIDNNGTPYDFDSVPMAFEFDLVDYNANGTLNAQFIQASPTTLSKAFSLKNSSYIGKTIKVVYTGTKMELYVDEVKTGTSIDVTFDSNNKIRVGFAFGTANEYVIVKNVKAYSI